MSIKTYHVLHNKKLVDRRCHDAVSYSFSFQMLPDINNTIKYKTIIMWTIHGINFSDRIKRGNLSLFELITVIYSHCSWKQTYDISKIYLYLIF